MHGMEVTTAIMIVALVGCGGGSGSTTDGGGGSDGGGGTAMPCTIAISNASLNTPVTTGTYHQCFLLPAPTGNNKVQVDAISLPGCDGCEAIWDFSPSDSCGIGGASMQLIDPTQWPTALLMEASSTNQDASCTIATSQLDVAGGHWSGNINAFLVATDANFMTVGFANVTLSGGF